MNALTAARLDLSADRIRPVRASRRTTRRCTHELPLGALSTVAVI